MRLYVYLHCAILLSILLVVFYLYTTRQIVGSEPNEPHFEMLIRDTYKDDAYVADRLIQEPGDSFALKPNDIVVAVVVCGDRMEESLTMMQSALMFSEQKIFFIIFAEDVLFNQLSEKVEWLSVLARDAFSYKIMKLNFPSENEMEWRRLFKPCAAQRLFLPSLLPEVDALLYVDTDVLFLTAVEDVWAHFRNFNESQFSALAPEHEDPNVGWYNRFAKHPYYGKMGINSGVMLMNLTRMREFKWEDYVKPIYKKYKNNLTWGDQDIINIIFHYHPGRVYIYPCRFNFRPDHCMYTSICKSAEQDGVAVLHGSRGFFHSKKQIVFYAFFQAVREFQIGGDLTKDFYNPLNEFLDGVEGSNCGNVRHVFMKNLEKYLDKGGG